MEPASEDDHGVMSSDTNAGSAKAIHHVDARCFSGAIPIGRNEHGEGRHLPAGMGSFNSRKMRRSTLH